MGGAPMTTPDLPPEVIEKAARALSAEGADPGDSIHSWRCEYPKQYGACDCVREAARAVLAAVTDDLAAVAHHPNCYQSAGAIPEGLPDDLCDCRVLRMLDAPEVAADAYQRGMVDGARQALLEARRLAVRCYPKGLVSTSTVIADLNEAVARIEKGA